MLVFQTVSNFTTVFSFNETTGPLYVNGIIFIWSDCTTAFGTTTDTLDKLLGSWREEHTASFHMTNLKNVDDFESVAGETNAGNVVRAIVLASR